MAWPVFFPNIKSKSTKDLILRILSEREQMTNQRIFITIKKQYGISVTYQAVRQALTELKDAGVLQKEERIYSISKDWIQNLCEYSEFLKKKYIQNTEIRVIDENTREIKLNSMFDMGHFILYSFKDKFFDMNNEHDLYMYVHHMWFPFFDETKREALRHFFSINKNLVLVRSKTLIDRSFSWFYKKFGTVKLGIKLDPMFDIIIQGDCVTKIFMPQELRDRMNEIYRTRNPFNFRVFSEFSKMTYHKYQITILIIRDKQIASEMKKQFRKARA